ncbi:DUF1444 family protein [Aliiroseovarius sp.]|uniref:DUF1444 family protein n=1 Tax=Aliiroseovarius sp. TaxID=1872442 RepID=UPI003BACF6FE
MLARFLFTLFLLSTPVLADAQGPDPIEGTLHRLRVAVNIRPDVEFAWVSPRDRSVAFRMAGEHNGVEGRIFGGNLHRRLLEAKTQAEREVLVTLYANPLPPPQELDPLTILPVLRRLDFLNEQESNRDLLTHPFPGGLVAVYAQDLPTRMAFPSRSHVAQIATSPKDLRSLAINNLRRYAERRVEFQGGLFGLTIVSLDGVYDTSLLLDETFWRDIDGRIGRVVAMAPSQDTLIYTDADIPGGVEYLVSLVTRTRNELSNPLSETLLEWTEDGWQVYTP